MQDFDEEFLRRLELLNIAIKRFQAGKREADKITKKTGGAFEFISHRGYSQGDEFRYIDWKVYARLEQLFVKQFAKEEAINLCILLDVSESMGFGKPPKIDLAKKMAQALGYIVLVNHGLARIITNQDISRRFSTRHSAISLFNWVQELQCAGRFESDKLLSRLTSAKEKGSALIIISDLWQENIMHPLKMLKVLFNEISVIHIVSLDEIEPKMHGKLSLIDCETSEKKELFLDEEEHQKYKGLVQEHFKTIEEFARQSEINYVRLLSDADFNELIFVTVRRAGIVT